MASQECHCIHADRAIRAADVLAVLQDAISEHGVPQYIRSDNGPKFTAKAIQQWLAENDIKTLYIDRGCPWQNGYAESINSRFRTECLDRDLLYTLSESRGVFADWREYYNHVRPHRSLGLLCPRDFAKPLTQQGPGYGRPTDSLPPGLNTTQKQSKENYPSSLD